MVKKVKYYRMLFIGCAMTFIYYLDEAHAPVQDSLVEAAMLTTPHLQKHSS